MFFKKQKISNKITTTVSTIKKTIASNASRESYSLKYNLNFFLKYKKLNYIKKGRRGKNNKGKVIMKTNIKNYKKINRPIINYKFRYLNLFFVAGFFILFFQRKIISLVYLSSGQVTYLISTKKYFFFNLGIMQTIFLKQKNKEILKLNNIRSLIFLIYNLPKNKKVSLLELFPQKKSQYVRSFNSKAFIFKKDSRINYALINLPSGNKKIFSLFAIGSEGEVFFTEKKKIKINKAGFYKNFGKNVKVRGVAMNPIDHPHGGRTKTIRYQRTPWGKTTKYK